MKPLAPLQQRPKFECPDCKKKYSQLHLCLDKIRRCRNCSRKRVTNKWYVQFHHRGQGLIGKYSLTNREKSILLNQFMNQGLSNEEAWKKINYHIYLLRQNFWKMKRIKRFEYSQKKQLEQDKVEEKKKFLEGLKQ